MCEQVRVPTNTVGNPSRGASPMIPETLHLARGPKCEPPVDHPHGGKEGRFVEGPVIVDPPPDGCVEHSGKVIEALVAASMQVPTPDFPPNRFRRLVADRRAETHEESAPLVLRPPGLERVAQKVEGCCGVLLSDRRQRTALGREVMNSAETKAAAWIIERRKCTLDMAFMDLRDFAQCYVDAANSMLTDQERKFPFAVQKSDGPVKRFVVTGFPFESTKPEDRVEIIFELHNEKIAITPDRTITQRWNPRTGTCVLRFEKEEWTAEQISHIALEPLFFGA